jgi:hypothetical protein
MPPTTEENNMAETKDYPGLIDVQVYVNPQTSEIDGIFALNFLGLCVRSEGDWEPVLRSETNIDEIASDDIYRVDWMIDDIPASEATEDDDDEHPLFEAYDNDTINLELIKYYCYPIQQASE